MSQPASPTGQDRSLLRARILLRHPAGWLATGLGVGMAARAPGTFGSIAALAPWLLLRELPFAGYLAAVAVTFALGVWASNWVIARTGVEDPGVVVLDEFVGLWIALALAPPGWGWMLAGLLLFRVFDIAKPWPVSWADRRIKGGFGAMFDDALAGLYAFGVLQLAAWWLGHGGILPG
ncbi:phosphatidylglycerophosphatase A [Coralloluteibacterium thermophilus]|uniref:Phosphatidylglycerophosphatase A n=1 Tax=Coralloluteibacterium thermophilum TaxID=2707049 RepID=A0ABV9NNF5_9GAMM